MKDFSREGLKFFFSEKEASNYPGRKVVVSNKPIKGFSVVKIEKVEYSRFYSYCKKAGISEEIIPEVFKVSKGYIENARYYIRIIKKKGINNVEEFKKNFRRNFRIPEISIIVSFFFASAKYFFYSIGWFNIGSFFAGISYIFMIFYFVTKGKFFK